MMKFDYTDWNPGQESQAVSQLFTDIWAGCKRQDRLKAFSMFTNDAVNCRISMGGGLTYKVEDEAQVKEQRIG